MPFKKGETANRNGRPATPYRQMFNAKTEKLKMFELAIKNLHEAMKDKDKERKDQATKYYIDQFMGKAPQIHDVEGNFNVKWTDLMRA
jgi:hypothetical protein